MADTIRIATFNVENLDENSNPSLETRIALLRPQFLRLRADILCLQEVHGQERPDQPRRLLALKELLKDTPYTDFEMVSTKLVDGTQVFDKRNLVIASRFPIIEHQQYKHDFGVQPMYQKATAIPPEPGPEPVTWERPIQLAKIELPNGSILNVINLHLKSKLPSNVDGQKFSRYEWKSVPGWAEGYFLSSMKRVGQALETRMLIDSIFDDDPDANIVVCGDFNADSDDVPVQAIRGTVEHTSNAKLAARALLPCERTIPESARFSLYHNGQPSMLDHLLVSQSLLQFYRGTEIHNETLHDESLAYAGDKKFPESDHAPVIAEFVFS